MMVQMSFLDGCDKFATQKGRNQTLRIMSQAIVDPAAGS